MEATIYCHYVCQTEGFQAVWRFLRPFRNLQIMTQEHN
jgi:hypothetical protein